MKGSHWLAPGIHHGVIPNTLENPHSPTWSRLCPPDPAPSLGHTRSSWPNKHLHTGHFLPLFHFKRLEILQEPRRSTPKLGVSQLVGQRDESHKSRNTQNHVIAQAPWQPEDSVGQAKGNPTLLVHTNRVPGAKSSPNQPCGRRSFSEP